MIRVMLVDDHAVVRGLMRDALNAAPGLCVIGAFSSGEAALAAVSAQVADVGAAGVGAADGLAPDTLVPDTLVPDTQAPDTLAPDTLAPDVIVLDISLPGMDGIETIAALRAAGQDIPVLCLTMHLSQPIKERAFLAGALGYAVKHDPFETLVAAIETVARGGRFVSPALGLPAQDAASDQLKRLSKREIQIISHVASGWTAAEIADFLKISARTVDFHRRSIAEKTGLRRIADITKFALAIGLRGDD